MEGAAAANGLGFRGGLGFRAASFFPPRFSGIRELGLRFDSVLTIELQLASFVCLTLTWGRFSKSGRP